LRRFNRECQTQFFPSFYFLFFLFHRYSFQVRHDFLDVSTRLNSLEEAYLESKSTAASGQVAVASCLSDIATHRATVEDLQRNVQQLQQAFDSAQPTRGQQLGTESILNEMKRQCQHLQLQLESMQQQQLLYAQLENRQNQLSERLIAIEQSARQLQEHQHDMQHRIQSQLEQFRQQDRDDMQRLVEDKFAAMSLRMTQLESHRESWTALERLVLSSSSSNSGNGHQALTLSDKVDHHEHCSGAHEIDGSYVSLQTSYVAPVAATEAERRPSLQITSVSVRFRHPNQDATTQLQLHARGGDICPSDADFAVSIGVNELAILDLQV
jgi:DNA repair exonuclease SbcCD ATPase subunit